MESRGGGGSDPPCRVSATADAALVAPAPCTPGIPKISDAHTERICAGYKPDQFSTDHLSISQPAQMHNRFRLHSQENPMSKLKLEHGVSRIRRAKLQSSVDQAVADDIELLAEWSNNETNYVINALLRFALTQDEDFQKYKASSAVNAAQPAKCTRPASTPIKPVSESATKSDAATTGAVPHA